MGCQAGMVYVPTAGGLSVGILPGASGTLLTSGGPAAVPSWLPPASVVPPYLAVTSASQAVTINFLYAANFASLVTFTLPATAPLGSINWFIAQGAGLFTVQCGAGQSITGAGVSVPVAGTISATAQGQVLAIINTTANSGWNIFFTYGGSFFV